MEKKSYKECQCAGAAGGFAPEHVISLATAASDEPMLSDAELKKMFEKVYKEVGEDD